MHRNLRLLAATLALAAAGCGSGDDSPAGNVSANQITAALDNAVAAANLAAANEADLGNEAAGNGGAAFPCTFAADDVKDWKAVQGKDGTRTAGMIIVTGKARTGDPRYESRLTRTAREDGVLRLWLTRAERDESSEAPADGWDALRYGPAERGISKVVVWCDQETNLAELDVEGAG